MHVISCVHICVWMWLCWCDSTRDVVCCVFVCADVALLSRGVVGWRPVYLRTCVVVNLVTCQPVNLASWHADNLTTSQRGLCFLILVGKSCLRDWLSVCSMVVCAKVVKCRSAACRWRRWCGCSCNVNLSCSHYFNYSCVFVEVGLLQEGI